MLRAHGLHSSSESRHWTCLKPQCRVLQQNRQPTAGKLTWPLRYLLSCDPASLVLPSLLLLRTWTHTDPMTPDRCGAAAGKPPTVCLQTEAAILRYRWSARSWGSGRGA